MSCTNSNSHYPYHKQSLPYIREPFKITPEVSEQRVKEYFANKKGCSWKSYIPPVGYQDGYDPKMYYPNTYLEPDYLTYANKPTGLHYPNQSNYPISSYYPNSLYYFM